MTASTLPIFDTHCHLDYIGAGIFGHDPERPLSDVVSKASENGVGLILNPSVNVEDFDRVLQAAEAFKQVYAAIGIHPCEVEDTLKFPDWEERVTSRLKHPKVKAIGESGLDYFHQTADSEHATLQKTVFEQHLKLAQKYSLPIIIHDREAHDDVLALVDKYPDVKGIMHCFGGDAAFALKMVERGYKISFAGNVTFKKALPLQEAAKSIPLEAMLIETDSPFLSPVPERGKPNEPYRTRFVAEFIANLRGISVEAVIQQTTQNALETFNIPAPEALKA